MTESAPSESHARTGDRGIDGIMGPFRDPVRPVAYHGNTGALMRLLLEVMALALLTATLYRFWGKTRIRQYLWSNTQLFGEPLRYTGTSQELLKGFLYFGGPAVAIVILQRIDNVLAIGFGFAIALVLQFAQSSGQYTGLRYRLSRTSWRDVQAHLGGRVGAYAMKDFVLVLQLAMTFGLSMPYVEWKVYQLHIENISLGNKNLSVGLPPTGIFKYWFIAWLLFVPTLGLSFIYYRWHAIPKFVGATRFADRRLRIDLTLGEVIGVYYPYWLFGLPVIGLIALQHSLGWGPDGDVASAIVDYGISVFLALTVWSIARVLVFHKAMSLIALELEMEGPIESLDIGPDSKPSSRFGEGLENALDIDTF
jgi:hypothetical protein